MGSVLTVTNLLDSGPGSLRATIATASSGDSIDFAVSGTISLSTPLDIGTSLTINGFGIAIDGSTSGTIFDVAGTASDTFADLTLSNATDAITGSSDAFVSLLASTISGGGDGLYAVNATVTNSTFAVNGVAISGGNVALYDSTISGGTDGTENTNLTIGNTIICGNISDVGSGTVLTDNLGNNLICNGGGLFTNGTQGDIVGTPVPC